MDDKDVAFSAIKLRTSNDVDLLRCKHRQPANMSCQHAPLLLSDFLPCKAEPDTWMRRNANVYEYTAAYVDDIALALHQRL
jgi:hypothetical protein